MDPLDEDVSELRSLIVVVVVVQVMHVALKAWSLRLITCARVWTRVIKPGKWTLVEPSLRRPHFGS